MKLKVEDLLRVTLRIIYLLFVTWAIFNVIFLTRFSDFDASQNRDDIVVSGIPDRNNPVGQTFIARRQYLSSIKFLLDIQHSDSSKKVADRSTILVAHLYDAGHGEIASTVFHLPNQAEKFAVEFSFPPQPDSLNKVYQVWIETNAPTGQLSIWSSLYNAYPDGEAFINKDPLPYDLAFWTYYQPTPLSWITDTLEHARDRFLPLVVITLAFLSVGYCVCSLSGCLTKDLIENTICAAVVGIATPPIFFLMMNIAGISINRVSVLCTLIVLGLLSGFKFLRTARIGRFQSPEFDRRELRVLAILFLLAAFTRVSQINHVIVPSWVGGMVHQNLVSKILDRQTIPFDAIYPKGFHANVVFDILLRGRSPIESTLLMGQWLSLMSGLAFYLLARKLLRSPYSLFTLGIYWFWTPFPAYLINWARYPYLQSLVLLPVAVQIYKESSLNRRSRYVLLTWLLIGLGLTYYGAFLILIAFVITDLMTSISTKRYLEIFIKMKGLAFAMLPILILLLVRLDHAFEFGVYGQDSSVSLLEDGLQTLNISLLHGGWLVWGLAIPGLGMTLILGFKRYLLMAAWILVLLTIHLLQAMLDITVSSLANTMIFLAIPLTLLAGLTFKVLWGIMMQEKRLSLHLVILLIAASGAYNISGVAQSPTTLFLSADRSAMDWITRNTPPNSVYLINSFRWGDERAPSDGGGWLTLLTGRSSFLYTPGSLENVLESDDIDYIYLGRGYGDLHSELFVNDRRFLLEYDHDGIKIYRRILHENEVR